jgi:serine/threonine protein kinase
VVATTDEEGRIKAEGSQGLEGGAVSQRVVAIKRIKPSPIPKEGVNFTALREIKYLRELKHENIIDVS